MNEVAQWYADRSEATALRFSRAVQQALRAIEVDPFRHPVVEGETRRLIVSPFPYGLFYRVTAHDIVVLACFHGRRNPRRWQTRR
ncbi:MAG: type II toxin-antitoxin system RelE/ParE family toxin [Variibacter sp.]|nr:type II toxin-antitoxin system RelE/ParE family toxin [Variibacter sp.]